MNENVFRDIGLVIRALHPQFLLLTFSCFALGVAAAFWFGEGINSQYIFFVFVGALAAHISVNGFNEYLDHRSGLDFRTKKTPFSGGSGILQSRPDLAKYVAWVSVSAFLVTMVVGAGFVWSSQNLWLGTVGLAGLFLIIAYTPWLTHNPWTCLVAPGVGFGFLMVGGICYVLIGYLPSPIWIGMLIVFFLINNLLLLNQYPDIEADKTVNRNHFPIVYGTRNSTLVYGIFALASVLLLIHAIVSGVFPRWTTIGILPLLSAPLVVFGALRFSGNSKKLQPFLGINVGIALGTPFLLAIGFWLAS